MDHFRWNKKTKFLKQDFQAFYDVVIIGGGVMGCSVAYWLAQRIYRGMKIAVIERDPTVRIKSKMRQQIINLLSILLDSRNALEKLIQCFINFACLRYNCVLNELKTWGLLRKQLFELPE